MKAGVPTRLGSSGLREQCCLIPAEALKAPGSPCGPRARSCCQVQLRGTSRVAGGGCYGRAAEGKGDASGRWVRGVAKGEAPQGAGCLALGQGPVSCLINVRGVNPEV